MVNDGRRGEILIILVSDLNAGYSEMCGESVTHLIVREYNCALRHALLELLDRFEFLDNILLPLLGIVLCRRDA